MRRQSAKTAKLYRDTRPQREGFLQEFPRCAVCGSESQCIDEITRGVYRMKGFVNRSAWLPACSICNTDPLTDTALWPMSRKLALKLFIDPNYFSLAEIDLILHPRRIDPAEVLTAYLPMVRKERNAA